MKPIFTVGGLYSRANGVAWIMRDLAAALGRAGAAVDVYAGDCIGRGAASIGDIFEPPTRWITRRGVWLGGLSWTPSLKAVMRRGIAEADVVHNHSLWMLPNSYGSRLAKRLNKPVVITAHGALEPWALANSGWKKKLVARWFQRRDLESAECLHVNSHPEIDGIRALDLKQPIAVIPNGVNLAPIDAADDGELFLNQYEHLRDQRILMFLARLHEKKGLAHLIEAWGRVSPDAPGWHLVVAGPDDGFESSARALVASHDLTASTTFTGRLDGAIKFSALRAARAYVLPSFSEGFSMSVLEAMASRLPVVITPGCNFPEAAGCGAAIEVTADVNGSEAGLRQLLSLSDAERRTMAEAGSQLIRTDYTWDSVAARTLQLYEWLNTGGSPPDFVVSA